MINALYNTSGLRYKLEKMEDQLYKGIKELRNSSQYLGNFKITKDVLAKLEAGVWAIQEADEMLKAHLNALVGK